MQSTISYRGYLIKHNPLNSLVWVEKDGQLIQYVFSFDDGRRVIDSLLDRA